MSKNLGPAEYKVLEELYNLEESINDNKNVFDLFSKFDFLLNSIKNEKFYNDYINILISLNEAGYLDLKIESFDYDGSLRDINMTEFLEEYVIEDIDVEVFKLTYEGRKACRIYLENELRSMINTLSGIEKEKLLTIVSEIGLKINELDNNPIADERVKKKESFLKMTLNHLDKHKEIYFKFASILGFALSA